MVYRQPYQNQVSEKRIDSRQREHADPSAYDSYHLSLLKNTFEKGSFSKVFALAPSNEQADILHACGGAWLSEKHLTMIEQNLAATVQSVDKPKEAGASKDKFQMISALTPAGEEADLSITGGAGWLSEKHLAAIEKSISSANSKVNTLPSTTKPVASQSSESKPAPSIPTLPTSPNQERPAAELKVVTSQPNVTGRPKWFVEDGTTAKAGSYKQKEPGKPKWFVEDGTSTLAKG